MEPGLNTIVGRDGPPLAALAWDSGTRAAAEGRDLAAVARALTLADLVAWHATFSKRCLFHETNVLRAELDRRNPDALFGPLFERE